MKRDQQGSGPGRRSVLGAAAALGAGGAVVALPGSSNAAPVADPRRPDELPVPTVIGHRGASGYRPEHTFGSYQLALDLGADVIEQDVVPTGDGHLVCRHENEIGGTTDVAEHPEFASRRTTRTIDGTAVTGWFTEDFTLAEIKTLRAKERLPANRQRNTLYDGRWGVPVFEDVLRWADTQGRRRGRPVWLHVETKHPTYFRGIGLELEQPLARLLRRYGRHSAHSPLFLQSFEPSSLRRLGELGIANPKIVLLGGPTSRPWDFEAAGDPRTVADLITPAGLRGLARFAQGIGPTLTLVIPTDATGRLGTPTTLVRDAHAAGLILHPYTMRNENTFLPADFREGADPNAYGDAFAAFRTYFEQGIDGIFSDNADTALLARDAFRRTRS